MSKAIYLFSNDLRLSDNSSIARAVASEPRITFIYCLDPNCLRPINYTCKPLGAKRYNFVLETLHALDQSLRQFGQRLHCFFAPTAQVLSRLHLEQDVTRIYHSAHAGFNERKILRHLAQTLPNLAFFETHTHTLFQPTYLPFVISDLPASFSKFRRRVEALRTTIPLPTDAPNHYGQPDLPALDWQGTLPSKTIFDNQVRETLTETPKNSQTLHPSAFLGGEAQGIKQLNSYFATDAPSRYKETRNALDDLNDRAELNGTRLSPWLANGSLSARQILFALEKYELAHGANTSTYWIYFELLWREYFQWYAHCHQHELFTFEGIANQKPLTSFYATRYQSWRQGNTPYPIVNACMNQLNNTGYMSNRGRQLVASCFVNELELDWRYGAAYFEEQLIDYDVASNWGNWQYLAGVGADTQHTADAKAGVSPRHFNLQKQTDTYDPEGTFIRKWAGEANSAPPLDLVDAVDWPVQL